MTESEVNEIVEKNLFSLVVGYVIGSFALAALVMAFVHPIASFFLGIIALIIFTIFRFSRFLKRLATPINTPAPRRITIPWYTHTITKVFACYAVGSCVFAGLLALALRITGQI